MSLLQPTGSLSFARLEPSWAFAICWIVVGILLYWAGNPPAGPAVFPDEVCRLGWARMLSGIGSPYEMSPGAYCQPYYALLLAPFQWLTQDPVATYRTVFVINSAIAAACLPLAVRLGIRHFGLSVGPAWVAGIGTLAYPSLTLYSHHALPETALFPGLLLTFALWCNWIDHRGWRQFTFLLAMSILLYALHRKMLVVPLALVGGAVAGCWFHRNPRYRIRTLLTILAVTMAFLLDELVKNTAALGGFHAGDAGAIDLLARLSSLDHLQNAAARASGVLVYATLVTGGSIWLVLAGGMQSIRHLTRDGFGALDDFTKKSAFAFAMVVMLLAVTATYFSTGTRFDLWFYGRHVDSALGIALLPAVAMITRRRANDEMLWWAIALALTCLLILSAVIPGPPWADFSQVHVIGAGKVIDWMHQATNRLILLAYSAAILAMAGIMFLARLSGALRFAALVPYFIVSISNHLTTETFEGVPIENAISRPAADVLREADQCHVYWDARNGGRLRQHQYFRLQYYFPECSIEIVLPERTLPPGSLVVVRRIFADCSLELKCPTLHPDLVLYKTTGG